MVCLYNSSSVWICLVWNVRWDYLHVLSHTRWHNTIVCGLSAHLCVSIHPRVLVIVAILGVLRVSTHPSFIEIEMLSTLGTSSADCGNIIIIILTASCWICFITTAISLCEFQRCGPRLKSPLLCDSVMFWNCVTASLQATNGQLRCNHVIFLFCAFLNWITSWV